MCLNNEQLISYIEETINQKDFGRIIINQSRIIYIDFVGSKLSERKINKIYNTNFLIHLDFVFISW